MSKLAWAYIWTILLVALGFAVMTIPLAPLPATQWRPFIALAALSSAAQMFRIEAPKEQTYYVTPLCFFAGILLLDPFLLVLVIVITHLAEWAKERWLKRPLLQSWCWQPLHIARHSVAALSAAWIYSNLSDGGVLYLTVDDVGAVTAAALCYVLLSQIMLAIVLVLAHGVSLRESGALDLDDLLINFVIVVMGYSLAISWQIDPWLIPLTLTPLTLFHRALAVHQLKIEAQTDSKTGLWNARHFATLFASELERAQRFQRPIAVIMADLDLLRNINNSYGHLAGDTVLAGIGQIVKKTIREYDIAGRFGGEEFVIVLPEVNQIEARAMAERIRTAIEAATFDVATSPKPLRATMSLGIACYPVDGQNGNDLIHAADVAVYQAKVQGRNRVVCTADVPHVVRIEHDTVENRLDAPDVLEYISRPEGITGIQSNRAVAELPDHPGIPSATIHGEQAAVHVPTAHAHIGYDALPRRIYVLAALVVPAALGTVLVSFATARDIDLPKFVIVGGLGMMVFLLHLALLWLSQKRSGDGKRSLERTNEQLVSTNREIIGINAELNLRNRELQSHNGVLQHLNDELFLTLARILDARDPFVGSHALQVSKFAEAIAAELDLPAERVAALRQAGAVHDIGKIVLPDRILCKPTTLTNEEYMIMQKHARIGSELLSSGQALRYLAPAVKHHHERWDGTGYPDGLRGPAIPLEARILSLCDAVEAMASDRPYKHNMSLEEIAVEVKQCAGTQFDPGVVAAFLRVIERDGGQMIIDSALDAGYRPSDSASSLPGDLWNIKEHPVICA